MVMNLNLHATVHFMGLLSVLIFMTWYVMKFSSIKKNNTYIHEYIRGKAWFIKTLIDVGTNSWKNYCIWGEKVIKLKWIIKLIK